MFILAINHDLAFNPEGVGDTEDPDLRSYPEVTGRSAANGAV